ncbi:MAG: metallophosphoesterase [Rhizobiales bacterium]|nr:metallophosphoesterase [Hyphomicrobiales bacterium]MBI3672277.1 metallophosphoesterase [Hyphomicrobiales bacterium]
MVTRRGFFKAIGSLLVAGAALAGYGFVIEPGFLLRTQVYALTPPRWPKGLKLRLVLLADPHCVEPYMSLSRWRGIIAAANELGGDMVLLLGDYVPTVIFRTGLVPVQDVAGEARRLNAPLGMFSINGNHDWWADHAAQRAGAGPPFAQKAFEDAGIPVLANAARPLQKDGFRFWLTGTDSMVAIRKGRGQFEGRDDLQGTLAQVTDDAPIIHMAHEPDLFVQIPDRVSLTLSGHTHGGQVRLFGWSPVTPSAYGNRFAYGHIVEDERHLVVSGGLGCSFLPVRFGMPPEITVIDLG